MRIRDLAGWPPTQFQCIEDPTIPAATDHDHGGLRLESVTYVRGNGRPGDMVLSLVNSDTTESCTARLKVPDAELARRAISALEQSKGLTLEQAGLREIPENEKPAQH